MMSLDMALPISVIWLKRLLEHEEDHTRANPKLTTRAAIIEGSIEEVEQSLHPMWVLEKQRFKAVFIYWLFFVGILAQQELFQSLSFCLMRFKCKRMGAFMQ